MLGISRVEAWPVSVSQELDTATLLAYSEETGREIDALEIAIGFALL